MPSDANGVDDGFHLSCEDCILPSSIFSAPFGLDSKRRGECAGYRRHGQPGCRLKKRGR